MVTKITTPPTSNDVIGKINELVDDKQDTITSSNRLSASLVSGLATVATSGSYTDLSNKPTIDSALSTSSTNAAQNKVITSALNGKLDGFTLRFAGNWSGGVHAVNFVTIDYSECNSENGVFIKFSMVNSHGNGQAGRFLQDVVLNVKYTGEVAGTLYRYFAVPIDQASSEYYGSHSYGDVFWVNDTTNKVVRFYVLMHQYSYTSQSPYFRLNASTKGVITQSTGGTGASEYSSGTRVWTTVNWFETDQTYSATSPKPQSGVAVASAISGKANSADLATVATSGSYNDLSNKPTIPTVNNAALTIQKNGSNVATFTANASSNVTANISVPTVDQTYSASSTNAQSGVAVANAIAPKQDTLVSGTNIKTINGTSLLGSGNITIETSSTPNVDGTTISYNTNDALQTIAVKNVRDDSTLPIWHGTEYQWNHGDPTIWYYWQTSVTALWTSGGTLPSSGEWSPPVYGNNRLLTRKNSSTEACFSINEGNTWETLTLPYSEGMGNPAFGKGVFVIGGWTHIIYSTDNGENWQNAQKPSGNGWTNVLFGNNNFVSYQYGSNNAAYSTDGITWITTNLPESIYQEVFFYVGGVFFIRNSALSYFHISLDDGETWVKSGNLPSSGNWNSIAYGNGCFVCSKYGSRQAAKSYDNGATWTEITLPVTISKVEYGNGIFVIMGENYAIYSNDNGETWNSVSNNASVSRWSQSIYADGKFLFIANNSDKAVYSTDGVTWTYILLPSSGSWVHPVYCNNKFVTIKQSSTDSAIFTVQYDKCYTDTANPTTTSVVYSEPETVSSYTISSVTSGAITLSNNNTYYYNQSGNVQTYQTVGDAHPEYLCFIDGVGVKIGNTTIATNNSNNS